MPNIRLHVDPDDPDQASQLVAGAYSMINYGSRPVGALLGGFIATVIDIRVAFVVAGALGIVSVILMLRSPMAQVRTIESAAATVR